MISDFAVFRSLRKTKKKLKMKINIFKFLRKTEKYKNTKKYVLSFFAKLKEYKNTKIKHVSSCFAKLKNSKQCFEMFPFEALQTFRVSSLSFEFHAFPNVCLCGLQIINQIKLKIKKYTFANQKRCLKFTASAKKFVFNECSRRQLCKVFVSLR